MPINMEKINELLRVLEGITEASKSPSRITKRVMVETLAKELQRLIKLGYTRRDLAALLARHGVEIHPNMLGQYIRDSKQDRSRSMTRKARLATGNSQAAEVGKATPEATGAANAGSPAPVKPGAQGVAKAAQKQAKDQPAAQPVKSGKTDTSNGSSDTKRDQAVSSGGFTVRSDSDDI